MSRLRLVLLALAASLIPASSAHAIVGGHDAPQGKYPYVAFITVEKIYGCTGTLVAPNWVVTAGHCSNLGTGTPASVPIGLPGQLVEVSVGSNQVPDLITGRAPGGQNPAVEKVWVNPNYSFDSEYPDGHDVALLQV